MVTRRQAVLVSFLAVLVLAAAIALLVTRGHDHRAPHRLLAGDASPSTTSPSAVSTTTTTTRPAAPTVRPRAAVPAPRTASGIVFIAGTGRDQIVVMNADGSARRQIAAFDYGRTSTPEAGPWSGGDDFSGVDWSRTADYIAAAREGKYGGGLEVMRPDGSDRHTLVANSACDRPTFAPDGKHLVFANPGNHLPPPGGPTSNITVIDVDGGNRRVLGGGDVSGADPAWSPDGAWIAFASEGIALVRPDGTGLHTVPGTTGAAAPAWSPDGSWISFVVGTGTGTQTDVYKIHPDGTGRMRLTDNHDVAAGPSWSPDGAHVVFARSTDTGYGGVGATPQLWVVGADGQGLRQLTSLPDGAVSPAWR